MTNNDLTGEDDNARGTDLTPPRTDALPPKDVFVYYEQRSCAEIVRWCDEGQINIAPDFQRTLVWELDEQSRFIDSLSKDLPIPSLCIAFSRVTNANDDAMPSNQRIVIDGVQRINTINQFLTNKMRLGSLDDIRQQLRGRTAKEIKEHAPDIYKFIENVTLPVTVVLCNLAEETHLEYIYQIFYRLNSGGQKLNAQEMRNCIFIGAFNTMLRQVTAQDTLFGKALHRAKYPNERFHWQEIALRFFAFYDGYTDYKGKVNAFLDAYMKDNRSLAQDLVNEKKTRQTQC